MNPGTLERGFQASGCATVLMIALAIGALLSVSALWATDEDINRTAPQVMINRAPSEGDGGFNSRRGDGQATSNIGEFFGTYTGAIIGGFKDEVDCQLTDGVLDCTRTPIR